ncbi:MAG: hypothetical protein DCF22_21675 [Leptolyngbya sp.]|nr:MAG: hypothetical protein DCF22_21675 [Leptolyngbya sp.]
MKMWKNLTASGLVVAGLAVGLEAANAYPRGVSPAQLQRISADLMRSDTQDFFRVGRIQLEREVKTIYDQQSRFNIDLLTIDPSIQLQPDLSPLEKSNLQPLKPLKH